VKAAGAANPSAAVEGLLGALDDGDITGMIGRLDPEEMAALYDYAPLFLPDADQSAELQRLAEYVTISDLRSTATGSGSERIVTISAATLTVDDGETHVVIRYADGCVHVEGLDLTGLRADDSDSSDPEVYDFCPGSSTSGLDQQFADRFERQFGGRLDDELGGASGLGGFGAEDLSGLSGLSDLFDPSALSGRTGIIVHQVDGAWYVSPSRTLFDNGLALFGALRDDAVGQLVESLSSLGAN
jgi:hypothetical protein